LILTGKLKDGKTARVEVSNGALEIKEI